MIHSIHGRRLLFLLALTTLILSACISLPIELIQPAKALLPPPTSTSTPLLPTPTPTSTPKSTPTSTPLPPTPAPTSTPLPPTPTSMPLAPTGSGTVVEQTMVKRESLSLTQIDGIVNRYMKDQPNLPSLYPVDVYRIWFRTHDGAGNAIAVQADLYVPKVAAETDLPLFVYGSGTTGVDNACATLNEYAGGRAWGNYRAHLSAYATQGYITALANWQGFDEPGQTHPYFVAELEGHVMLDLTRAIYDFFSDQPPADLLARPADAVFFGGYSQGGHGAFAGDAMAPRYAPELNILGVIGHAMAPDVEGLMKDSPLYAPYIVQAYRDYYGEEIIDPEDVFQECWMPTYDLDVRKCIDDVLRFYPNTHEEMYTPRFQEALQHDQLATEFPEFKAMLDHNYVGREVNPSTPAIILHGDADPIVQMRTVDPFVTRLCEANKQVTYRVYPGVHHFSTRQYSHVDTLEWMQNILAGVVPASDCGYLVEP